MIESEREREQSNALSSMLDRVLAAAHSSAVFSAPVEAAGHTVITASEVSAGGGFGYGGGSTTQPEAASSRRPGAAEASGASAGHGGGGGGGSMGRPVAVISISADGVSVQPVVDATKLAIAGITAWGAIAVLAVRMLTKARRG
jgi:uncharacterized spore protein YtfJ